MQPFLFKQFSVVQNKCAMKVNTDGVLLGAWQTSPQSGRILDIGTGTGVIALMMAQKNPTAKIDAIDIDHNAWLQAKENFEQSPWSDRLTAIHTALQNFETENRYDLIISNPPYFIDDYKTKNAQKNIAKHSTALSYQDLISGITHLLTPSGQALLILPAFNFSLFKTMAAAQSLFVTRLTEVTGVEGKAPYLVLLQLEREERPYTTTALTIQDIQNNFTQAYKTITKDFYLKF